MDSWVIALMLGASIFLGGLALIAFLWGIKSGQFDDEKKFLNQARFDGDDDLQEAAEQERKKETLKKRSYKPE
ncbi:MAG: cbb3-type cytochrome oxidase assembly protein CcoS [Campylobacterales bacterium]|nr:cbb3-type cytochrome oxidase assembly protein CcoS [Campylobacterales bacterium]